MYPVNLKVFCSNSESGCDWQGELGQLDQHFNLNPDKDKLLIGCMCLNKCQPLNRVLVPTRVCDFWTLVCVIYNGLTFVPVCTGYCNSKARTS